MKNSRTPAFLLHGQTFSSAFSHASQRSVHSASSASSDGVWRSRGHPRSVRWGFPRLKMEVSHMGRILRSGLDQRIFLPDYSGGISSALSSVPNFGTRVFIMWLAFEPAYITFYLSTRPLKFNSFHATSPDPRSSAARLSRSMLTEMPYLCNGGDYPYQGKSDKTFDKTLQALCALWDCPWHLWVLKLRFLVCLTAAVVKRAISYPRTDVHDFHFFGCSTGR